MMKTSSSFNSIAYITNGISHYSFICFFVKYFLHFVFLQVNKFFSIATSFHPKWVTLQILTNRKQDESNGKWDTINYKVVSKRKCTCFNIIIEKRNKKNVDRGKLNNTTQLEVCFLFECFWLSRYKLNVT